MSKYTIELRSVVSAGINIFDFEYQRTPESLAILSDDALQHGFIRHFNFREIGFETIERFKYMLQTQWIESLGEFDTLLVEYSKPILAKANYKGGSASVAIFNDTPKSALDYGEQSTHASNIASNKSDNVGFSNTTEIELLAKLHDNIKDIQTEFYDSFDNLFMQIF